MNTSALDEMLRHATTDGQWCTGAQIAFETPDAKMQSLAVGVDGLGTTVTPQMRFPIYCAAKPLTALAIGILVDAGEASFDDRIADILETDGLDGVPTRISDILSHKTGLWKFPALNFLTLDRATRREHVLEALRREPTAADCTYAEFVGWEILALVIQRLTDSSWEDFISDHVLAPLGLLSEVVVRPEQLVKEVDSLGVNVSYLDAQPLPMLWERSTDNLRDVSAASGAYATAVGLCTLYREIGSGLKHQGLINIAPQTLQHLVTPTNKITYDRILRRDVAHAFGFMADLSHGSGRAGLSAASFGHSGMNGMTFAGFDPEADLAFAVHLNGVTDQSDLDDASRSALTRRHLIIAELLKSTRRAV